MNIIDIDKLPEKIDNAKIIEELFNGGFLDVSFKYKSNYKNTKKLRDFVETICNFLELSDKMKTRMVLISDELNNNAIEYGSNKNGINYLRIKAEEKENSIDFNLEVEDNGKGKKHKTALDMETLRAHQLKLGYFNHDSIRGRGLFLITVKVVDRLYFKNSNEGGLIVGVKTKIKKD